MISLARASASSGVAASFTPPALPRPPTRTWALTTTAPAMRCAAAPASSGEVAVSAGNRRMQPAPDEGEPRRPRLAGHAGVMTGGLVRSLAMSYAVTLIPGDGNG